MCAAKEYVKKNGFNIKAIVSLIVISSFVVTCFMAIAFFIFNAQGADKRSRENEKQIIDINLAVKEVTTDQRNFSKTLDMIHQEVKENSKDTKIILRRTKK